MSSLLSLDKYLQNLKSSFSDMTFSPPKFMHPESPPFANSGLTPPHQPIEEISQPTEPQLEQPNREQIILNRSPREQPHKQQPVYIIPISGPQMLVKNDMGGQKKPKKVIFLQKSYQFSTSRFVARILNKMTFVIFKS